MDGAAKSVKIWCAENIRLPGGSDNQRTALVSLTVDNVSSTRHFVHRLGRQLAKFDASVTGSEEYPSDQLMALIESAHEQGLHPVVIINRFHAFARIADDHLLSMLSTMRSLEHDGLLTTLAFSTLRYQALRTKLSRAGHFPFVNSAYGDNHDEVALRPITRDDFISAASAAGLTTAEGYQLHRYAGGPDKVFEALLTCGNDGLPGVAERACALIGNQLETFFENAIDPELPDCDELRVRLATGQLQPSQEDYLENTESAGFLVRRTSSGRLIATSPVLSRLLLRGRDGPWRRYTEVLEHLYAEDFSAAAAMVSLLDQRSPHLKVFAQLVDMLRAVYAENIGLLGIDWTTIERIGQALLTERSPIGRHAEWVRALVGWARRVKAAVDTSISPDVRLDVLARGATDEEVKKLFVFVVATFLKKAGRSDSPTRRVRDAAVVPESILQALAYSLGLDVRSAPDRLPELDYQIYFGRKDAFQPPVPGQPITMTQLLVIVPALVAGARNSDASTLGLTDAGHVVPLHEKLVVRFRNAASHTYTEATEKDAHYLYSICGAWLEDLKIIWNLADLDETAMRPVPPTAEDLAQLLYGEDRPYFEATSA
ncbi:hypothetical protein [Mesorhizobium sp. M0088]|uniref:hypothetical protein n=1 Tax=Mesorhizobium sp. M0088 TaxID=2956873 RepID=UPI003336B029